MKFEYIITCEIEAENKEAALKEFVKEYGYTILKQCDKYDVFKILHNGFRSLIEQIRY